MKASEVLTKINQGGYDPIFTKLYGDAQRARSRAAAIVTAFTERFGDMEGAALFSAPGRTELIGNHTDHNGGKAVAAAIDLDIMAIAAPKAGVVQLAGDGEDVDIGLDDKPQKGTAAALAWGMAKRLGGGFAAYTNSTLPVGKGLSSSAAFSVLCGKIVDSFYGDGKATELALALTAKVAENEDYGKACGLLDQTACALGGTVHIDFGTTPPRVSAISYDTGHYGIYLVDTGVSHVGCEEKYAAIAEDMKTAAAYFGAELLCGVDPVLFNDKKERLRMKHGERVYRRALHYFNEDKRVTFFCKRALLGRIDDCLYAVNGSGISSRVNLGNVHKEVNEATEALKDIAAAIRIHGGGFGGAMQCYIKKGKEADFVKAMEDMFGDGCVIPVKIRDMGVLEL